ncbi:MULTISPECIES: ImmA/IrrE family metallo-endopeptidase [unclassified Bradyrhizobium]|uniref:ImmA/IrrE family metallo-endopeptidase n=1 Tax=unclassified Bradyrhizobium TaxID=2631580 RepID=UPI0003F84C05|nr:MULTISPECIES: ImmA/IrrE family metallo-endopeptidase [unclassified Bradyrhizobium]QIG98579.1 ImmA/IrrE family metallo-endopeptidase [Bradyrhizobium sp. 6(2017)]
MDPTELARELRRDPEPKRDLLRSVARELVLPAFAFYMQRLPALEESIPDFRSLIPEPGPKSRETVEAIKLAEGIQKSLIQFEASAVTGLPAFTAETDEDIDRFALKARAHFSITLEDQQETRDARTFYVLVRRKIEEKGVVVLQDSFPREDGSGFCLAHRTHPLILINTKQQTRARRLFTLAHELAHVLMGMSGISDPFVRRNAIERRCNRFAGSFLVPQAYVPSLLGVPVTRDPDLDDVRWAARKLKVSQEATVLRLEQLKIYKNGSHSKWLALVHNDNPDYSEKGGGGKQPPAQEKVKLAKYGFTFARAFRQFLEHGIISEIDLYRASGLKPKYQKSYFEYVNSLSANELRNLELDDG